MPTLLKKFLLYRTYHGCAMPVQTQLASIAAWNDEAHVRDNRDLYRQKFDAVLEHTRQYTRCERNPTPVFICGPARQAMTATSRANYFAAKMSRCCRDNFSRERVTASIPGEKRVRMALVATLDECVEAATTHRTLRASLSPQLTPIIMLKNDRVQFVLQRLQELYPQPPIPLEHKTRSNC